MNCENTAQIGNGIYTVSDLSRILQLPKSKVGHWLSAYWDGKFGKEYQSRYSWKTNNVRAVSFHTLIEFYVFYQLAEIGVKTRAVLIAHQELSTQFKTPFPFALQKILCGMKTDGGQMYFQDHEEVIVALDRSKQIMIQLIDGYFKKIGFDQDDLAMRFYPLGPDKKIVVDPKRQFGHPVVGKTNIYPETLYQMFRANDPLDYIAFSFEIPEHYVRDAITYCKAA